MSSHQDGTTMMMFMMNHDEYNHDEIGESSQPLHHENDGHSQRQEYLCQQYRQQVDELQEEVSYENEVGKDLLRMGKSKTALYHFSKGLQAMQRLSVIKKRIEAALNGGSAARNDDKTPGSSFDTTASVIVPGVTRLGRPLPIDTLSTASTTEKWEVFGAIAIMHNSALAHHQDRSYLEAKQMCSLAVKLLRSDLSSPADLNRLLKASRYAATVVVSLYALLGKTLSILSPKGVITKEAKKALTAAAGLQKRFLATSCGGNVSTRSIDTTKMKQQVTLSTPTAAVQMQVCGPARAPDSVVGEFKLPQQNVLPCQHADAPLSPSTVMSEYSVRSRSTLSTSGNTSSTAAAAAAPYMNNL